MHRRASRPQDNYSAALAGLDGTTVDTLVGGLGSSLGTLVSKETARLENALKLIIALSAVGAACGLVAVIRGR